MKGSAKRSLTLFTIAIVSWYGAINCGGGATVSITIPDIATIRLELGASNPYGMVEGLTLGTITLPECTVSNVDDVTYSLTNLPSWLLFDASTRAITLTTGTIVPADANTAVSVTYTCASASDTTINDSITFTINDLDGGGVVDSLEYANGEVPLLNSSFGWIWLTPGDVDIYRTPVAGQRKIPTGCVLPTVGMDPTNAADDTDDFDGDASLTGGGTNDQEIANGTNLFVAPSAATFVSLDDPALAKRAISSTLADVDNDSYVDIITANNAVPTAPGGYQVVLNNGDGTFTAQIQQSVSLLANVTVIVSADFDADGLVDIAYVEGGPPTNEIYVHLGNGDGTFASGTPYVVSFALGDQLAVGDLDGDGDVDMVMTDSTSNNASILLNDGSGGFTVSSQAVGHLQRSLALGDFDNDGNLDLVVDNATTLLDVSILFGNGDGTFGTATTIPGVGAGVWMIQAADFDGDGFLDVATAAQTSNMIFIALNNGDGTFGTPTGYTGGTGNRTLIPVDVDGDSDIDVVTTDLAVPNKIYVLLNDGTGALGALQTIATFAPNFTIYYPQFADFDLDGDLDLAITNFDGAPTNKGYVSIFDNQ